MTTTKPFNSANYLNHISLDCVIFGFSNNELKVLLLHLKYSKAYTLPGGFLGNNETLEEAAKRIVKERTGLDNLFLRQFKIFSDPERARSNKAVMDGIMAGAIPDPSFFDNRFISIGFYALVDFSKVKPTPDLFSDRCDWIGLNNDVSMLLDHKQIIQEAHTTLRLQLNQQPIGLKLLPKKFTMPELQKLYETILGRELDRRNFQRKMLNYNILDKLKERKTGGAHKSPYLYSFNIERYQKALEDGLSGIW
ncbi:NUDIX domain-containing protein [uncultured Draconibacterium sp.]|uniref:NUDIX hydrolase n=1 Tax=uncultured Draconibacterium sp. TaxID=1573823 RepID=UPI0029C6BCB5|nr:NUDIX domain-containing protein [uncultured Draconibacterium sp.]